MKKTVLLTILAFAAFFPVFAQNNPYDIDDECYKYFSQCDVLAGTDEFEPLAAEFLRVAILKEDTKAQTLYYVVRLKHAIRQIPAHSETTNEQDLKILELQNDLKEVADKFGYPQYFYYSYTLVQNYFYNRGKRIQTAELLQEMHDIASERDDEYGTWQSLRYMASLYISQGDYVTAKPIIQEAIELYNNSTDDVVKRQSITRLYCDLADTYLYGSDSVRVNIEKAVQSAELPMDTLRSQYYMAKLSFYEKDLKNYYHYRDVCRQNPQIMVVSETALMLFDYMDSMLNHTFDATGLQPSTLSRMREYRFLANAAEVYGYKEDAFEMEKQVVVSYENMFASNNSSKVAEINARLDNTTLHTQLDRKSAEVLQKNRTMTWLITLILLIVIAAMVVYSISLTRHNKKLALANEQVTLANAAKTRFVQNMSHEVRTPLNAIIGFSQLLALPDGSFTEEEKEEFSNHIVNNSKMLTMLLDDILNISAMDSGKYRIANEECEMHFMARAAITSSEHRLQPGVTMTYEPESQEPFNIIADPRRVQQILINLLTNSCKHTTSGSIVLTSSTTVKPGFVSYAVTDTGTGVPPEKAEAIFERFTKLDEFVQGTGLGLSICRDIATRMGAEVYLDTTWPGPGARFIFNVPVKPPQDNKPNIENNENS